jgi:thiol-disulfide isomerase/thioredoxin
MKKILSVLVLLAGLSATAGAREGYRIAVKFADFKDTMVYLVHYYAKPLPTIYKSDSALVDKNGVALFDSKKTTLGGIYLLLTADKKKYVEFLLNNGDDIGMTIKANGREEGPMEDIVFKNSPENERFLVYMKFLKTFGDEQQRLQRDYAAAKNAADSSTLRKKINEASKQLTTYRHDYAAKYPKTLLGNVFNALATPEVPEGVHKMPNGEIDSSFAYDYFKGHYWDKFDFQDDRLIHTPIYDAKLDEYINKFVVPVVDSVIKEADILLKKTRGTKELFKYTLHWLTYNAETSKIMGMDAVFVYLVENYHMKGDAFWLSADDVARHVKRAQELSRTALGNLAADIKMQDIKGKPSPLFGVKAKYTVVVFWEPSCGHCQKEIPQLDSVYKAVLKAKGVKVYAVRTDDPVKQWQDFITKYKLEDWTHVYDPEHKSTYHSDYDIKSTPTIYLLDEKKIIIGKRLDHSNIGTVIEMEERKAAKAAIRKSDGK